MDSELEVKPLAEALSGPIIKAHKVGGLGLVLVFVGTLLLTIAVVVPRSIPTYIAALVGALIILIVLIRFYFLDIKKLQEASRTIKDNEELLNAVQASAIQMTELSSHLQSLAFKHADLVAPILSQAREAVRKINQIPLIGNTGIAQSLVDLADHEKAIDLQEFANSIVEYTEAAKDVIDDVRKALSQLDAEPLKKYHDKVEEIDEKLKELLRKVA